MTGSVSEIFDFGHNAMSWTLAALRDIHRFGFHRKPPFCPSPTKRESEGKRDSFGPRKTILQINSDRLQTLFISPKAEFTQEGFAGPWQDVFVKRTGGGSTG